MIVLEGCKSNAFGVENQTLSELVGKSEIRINWYLEAVQDDAMAIMFAAVLVDLLEINVRYYSDGWGWQAAKIFTAGKWGEGGP